MEYIKRRDLEYILNKYHDTEKPFNPLNRFVRNDNIFSPDTGISGDEIKKEVLRQAEENTSDPLPIRKARALEYVLKNTRVSCDSRDIFPAVNAIDRPLGELISAQKRDVFLNTVPEVEKKRASLERLGAVTVWPDFDHSVPNWERVFSLGFEGLLRESEAKRHSRTLTEEEDSFFEGIKITYEAILNLIDRLALLADRTDGSARMALALKSIRHAPPKSFYEALLTSYLYFIISEHIEGLQVRSLGNFDKLFYPYYKSDLGHGVSEEQIREDLAYYLLQFAAIGNYWNQPVYLGGEYKDGKSVINELSYLFLDVYDKMSIYSPKIQIKVSKSTPRELILSALDMIRRGHSSIVFVSDRTVREALMRIGCTEDEAREADIKGCYEYSPKESFGTGMNYFNLLKPLEYALHGGCDGVTGEFSGESSPPLEYYTDFDLLYNEYKRQLGRLIDVTVEVVNGFENYLVRINQQSMLSATFESSIAKARDAIHGGSRSNGSLILYGFLADISDSLAMIKKYVYERRELTLTELVGMLDKNFEGSELFRKRLLSDRDKYGNNRPLPDEIAVDIAEFATARVVGRSNASERSGRWNCGFHVARMSYTQGKKTAASANGRRLGEELSKNISASMGQNREGATAAILSATKIDATSFASDACLDLGLLPSAVKGEDGLLAMYGLLATFIKRGGHAMHINVFDAETLRDAQAYPEKYQDLQIRVCGWNVLWNNINKEEQDGFIRQAEALL